MGHALPAAGACIARSLDQRAVDLRQRVGDRADHQQRVEMHIGDDDRELGEQQEVERLRGETEVHHGLIERAGTAEERDPGNGADDGGGEEGDGAEQKEDDAHRVVAHVKDQEIGDVEAEKEGDGPHDCRELEGTEVDAQGRGAGEDLAVAVEQEGGVDADAVVVEEADDQEEQRRQCEQDEEDRRQRQHLQPRYGPRWKTARPCVRYGVRPLAPAGAFNTTAGGEGSDPSSTVCECVHCGACQAAFLVLSRQRISGMMRVPNCSMPMTKSSNVSITPRTPGTVDISSSMRATLAQEPTRTPWLVGSLSPPSSARRFGWL